MNTRRRSFITACVTLVVLAYACSLALAAGTVKPTGDSVIVNAAAKNVAVKTAIEMIFKGTGLSYRIQGGVEGMVIEFQLKGVTLDSALKAIADEAGLTVTLEKGVYIINAPTRVLLGRGQQQAPIEQLAPLPEVASDASAEPTDQTQTGDSGPVYYGQPGAVAYPYGYPGPPPAFQYGLVQVVGGYTPTVLAPAHPDMYATAASPVPLPTHAPFQPAVPSPYLPFPISAPIGW